MIKQITETKDKLIADFVSAVQCRKAVSGLTHIFYRYPARFSPQFAKAAIRLFSEPGDVVLDPFMGGGTTLVEANSIGRSVIGMDVSHLAFFVAQLKTSLLSNNDLAEIGEWYETFISNINLRKPPIRADEWIAKGYQRNINGRNTWPIRKTIELALAHLDELRFRRQRNFARCVILKTAQWALDCRLDVPAVAEFRKHLLKNFNLMSAAAIEFRTQVRNQREHFSRDNRFRVLCLNRSADGIEEDQRIINKPTPKLVLTSPPYPGVHVVYHRWQVQGRRETPAPFWIADGLDGKSNSHYTFGDRKQSELKNYFEQLYAAYSSITQIVNDDTLLIQLVAFSEPSWQLPKYLETMTKAGFSEEQFTFLANSDDGRLWRQVPNRKWYAQKKGVIHSSNEVVLFHRPKTS